jgi:hypothetical protein
MARHKKAFSKISLKEILPIFAIEEIGTWQIHVESIPVSAFFEERLQRLNVFDLRANEHSKELLIDAFLEEALLPYSRLKFWKSAPLEDDLFLGEVDYLLTKRKDYLDHPLLCVVEAKKDDFEKGKAQCLAELRACWWNNQQANWEVPLWGIVTNADVWRFYHLTLDQQIQESAPYSIIDSGLVLAVLRFVFQQCEELFV